VIIKIFFFGCMPIRAVNARYLYTDKVSPSCPASGSLQVTLYHWTRGADFVGIEIPGVDCAYWHTAEEEDLDYHIELAKAALRGDVAYNRSPFMRYKEVCFKAHGTWECTRIDNTAIFHYLTTRKHLKKDKDYRKTKL
jgi:hypothetical protein